MTQTKRRRQVRRRRNKKQKNRNKKILLVLTLAAALCAVGIFAVSYAVRCSYVGKLREDRICNGISIGPVDVSGMTADEAKAALEKQTVMDGTIGVTLRVEEQSAEVSLKELGFARANQEELIQEALNYGKKGSVWKRYRQIKKLEGDPLILEEEFRLNPETGAAALEEKAAPLASNAVDATMTRTGTGFEVTPEREGKTVDVDTSLQKITKYLNGEWNHEAFAVDLDVIAQQPKVTQEDLKKLQDELGTFSTDAGGGDRWNNLKTGVEKLNGIVLLPGEELSVYNATAPYDEENGYVEAGSYENGQVVPAYGGGICQVSTTLYNAVILAELEIVERYPHSMTVAYVDPSRDAAIAGGYMDFKFRNNQQDPIYIYGEIDALNQLRFTIYGRETRPENRTIDFESETVSSENYGIKYKENTQTALGVMQYTGSPHVGKQARLWKIVYENGAEVSREIFNNSSYAKSDQIIEVGTACDNADASALVRNAILTQDASAIQDAINQAYAILNGTYTQETAPEQQTQEQEPLEETQPEQQSEGQ